MTKFYMNLYFTSKSENIPAFRLKRMMQECHDWCLAADDPKDIPEEAQWFIRRDVSVGENHILHVRGVSEYDKGHELNFAWDLHGQPQSNPRYYIIVEFGSADDRVKFVKEHQFTIEKYWYRIGEFYEEESSEESTDSAKETWNELETDKLRKELAGVKEGALKLNEQYQTQLKINEQLKKDLEAAKGQERIIGVKLQKVGEKPKIIKGLFHQQFERVMKLVQRRKNTFCYGPSGSGKSWLCKQVADSLGLPFYFVSCTGGMSEGVISGRLLPIGAGGRFEYIMSQFVKAYESGGVFFADEMDAADPNVLLTFNASLDNSGQVSLPNRFKKPVANRHPDFVFIAAANTVGTGADRLYTGRNRLDNATLSRFQIGKVFIDYDPLLEEKLCPNDELRTKLLQYRTAINEHRLERDMSTRFMTEAYNMMYEGPEDLRFSWADVEAAFFQGWRPDEVQKVKSFR